MADLEGILVVSVEHAVAAPYASGRLADAGARVIKVERPEGDFARRYDTLAKGNSAYFVWLNRGKESVALNLKEADDLAILKTMVSKADVFIQNLSPGVIGRLGLPIPELRERYPRLITCSVSGFGPDGPWRNQKAYDLLVQAESGLCAINGTPEGAARVGVSVGDIAAGMSAYQSILRALFARERSGKGRSIEVSLFHSLTDWMNVPYLQYRYGGVTPARNGMQHPTIAPYGAFPCKDNKLVLISIQNGREWTALCTDVLGDTSIADRPEFASNSLRVANRDDVDSLVAGHFRQYDREEIIEELASAHIAYGRFSELGDLAAHPQNKLVTVETENGSVELLAPSDFVVGETLSLGPVPSLDGQGAAIRNEFSP